jgi:hypothetical protein
LLAALFSALVIVAVVIWLARRLVPAAGASAGAPAWWMRFLDGRVTESHGRIPRPVYNAFEEVGARAAITGEVVLAADGALAFSPTIPEAVRQQLRNAYVAGRGR